MINILDGEGSYLKAGNCSAGQIPAFIEAECSLLWLQKSVALSCPEPIESSFHLYIFF
jgi:hypothetical protein